jgi:dTDP-glucose 4,6-dehydratase
MIIHALEGKPLPIYADGSNVCDWLRVSDHCDALMSVIDRGRIGERNNVGGGNERSNGDVVGPIRDGARPCLSRRSRARVVVSVLPLPQRSHAAPSHCYAIDAAKTGRRTRQHVEFEAGLGQTVRWYLARENRRRGGTYKARIDENCGFGSRSRGIMRILRAQRELSGFEAWLYRRQPGLENAVCISLPDLLTSQLLLLDWSDPLHARQN